MHVSIQLYGDVLAVIPKVSFSANFCLMSSFSRTRDDSQQSIDCCPPMHVEHLELANSREVFVTNSWICFIKRLVFILSIVCLQLS